MRHRYIVVCFVIMFVWLALITRNLFGDAIFLGGNVTDSKEMWRVQNNNLVPRSTSWDMGIASTTPFGQLGIGTGGNVTSTISTGKFCMYAGQENGVSVYVYMPLGAEAGEPFATTTQSCF